MHNAGYASTLLRNMSSDSSREAVHTDPVWREKADFIIAVSLDSETDGTTEQLWVRRIGDRQFEICCIPFFAYDLALGDVVETSDDYLVRDVVQPSGRYVFRVWFGGSFFPRDEVASQLSDLGAVLEWSSVNLLAVDAVDHDLARRVSGWLRDQEREGRLTYETG